MIRDQSSQREHFPGIDSRRSVIPLASCVLEYLSKDPTVKFGGVGGAWSQADGLALFNWRLLEHDLASNVDTYSDRIEDSHSVGSLDPLSRLLLVGQFQELRHTFHIAFPYSEAERTWLLQTADEVEEEGKDADHAPMAISQREGQIISAGVRQVVRGHDLIRRWIAWHQETGEYAGQNTIGVARNALAGIISLLESDQPLPDVYLGLLLEA